MFDVQKVFRVADIALVHRYGIDDGSVRECVQGVLERACTHVPLGDLQWLLRVDFVCVCTDVEPRAQCICRRPHTRTCWFAMRRRIVCHAVCHLPAPRRRAHVDGRLPGRRLPAVFPVDETLFVTVAHTLALLPYRCAVCRT